MRNKSGNFLFIVLCTLFIMNCSGSSSGDGGGDGGGLDVPDSAKDPTQYKLTGDWAFTYTLVEDSCPTEKDPIGTTFKETVKISQTNNQLLVTLEDGTDLGFEINEAGYHTTLNYPEDGGHAVDEWHLYLSANDTLKGEANVLWTAGDGSKECDFKDEIVGKCISAVCVEEI